MAELNGPDNGKKSDFKGQIISIIVLTLLFLTFWNMLDLALLTFIITFILYNIVKKLQASFKKISKHGLPAVLVLALVYVIFIVILVLVIVNLVPKIMQQVTDLSQYIMRIDFGKAEEALDPRIADFIGNIDIDIAGYLATMGGMLSVAATKIGQFSFNLFIAMVLSFFLVAEKDKIKEFGKRLGSSKISFIYKYFIDFGGVFVRTFGNVMKVQVTIALVNATISSVILWFMGFPSVIGLGFMMFCLGLVPVMGVAVSLIPLCTIAFAIGGFLKIIEVVAMILVLHALEAYILNPKLMANRVRLPVCFVFIILIIAEHYLSVWGLLIGVPIFIFLMTVLDVNYAIDKHKKHGKNDRPC